MEFWSSFYHLYATCVRRVLNDVNWERKRKQDDNFLFHFHRKKDLLEFQPSKTGLVWNYLPFNNFFQWRLNLYSEKKTPEIPRCQKCHHKLYYYLGQQRSQILKLKSDCLQWFLSFITMKPWTMEMDVAAQKKGGDNH